VLDALGVEQAAVVGHSMGGIVGTCVAALHPERVTRLVLGDIGPEPAPEGVARIRAAVAERDTFVDLDDAFGAQRASNPTADPVALRARVAHNLVERPDGTFTWKYDPALRDGTARYENYATDEQWAFLAAIRVPVLILRGERSDILSVDIVERMRAANPRVSVVELPGSGHSIATDVPDLVTAALEDFLGASAAPEAP
jgi:pimeloyl-ACP methyl ester carboxylesterase